MKKSLFILWSVILLSACVKNETAETAVEPVEVNIGVGMQREIDGELGTRAGVDAVDWGQYDVRYILEARTSEGERALRTVINGENMGSPVSFNIRLIPGEYEFLCWADIVSRGSNADVCYDTDDLRAVKIKDSYTGASVYREAFAWRGSASFSSAFSLQATLVRPFAKLMLENKTENNNTASVTLTFSAGTFMDTYDVMTGVASASGNAIQPSYPSTVAGNNVLAWDFLFVPESEITAFQVSVGSAQKQVNNIQLKKNTVTRVIGEFVNK